MYKYPILEHNKKRGLKFQAKWFDEFPWLVYSEIKSGVFCQKCVIFSKTGGALNQPLGQLVLREFNNWKKAKKVIKIKIPIVYFGFILTFEYLLKTIVFIIKFFRFFKIIVN